MVEPQRNCLNVRMAYMCTGKVRRVVVLSGPYLYSMSFVPDRVYQLKIQEERQLVGYEASASV